MNKVNYIFIADVLSLKKKKKFKSSSLTSTKEIEEKEDDNQNGYHYNNKNNYPLATFVIKENLHDNQQEGSNENNKNDYESGEGEKKMTKESIIIDGEIIPPKPEFPNNCCMRLRC